MYLSELNSNDRKDFLELAFYAMGVNGEHKENEQSVYQAFVHECEFEQYDPQHQSEVTKVITKLSKKSNKIKRIVVIELLGILLADGEICEAENEFLSLLATKFDMETYEIKKIKRWVENMNDLVAEGYRMLEVE